MGAGRTGARGAVSRRYRLRSAAIGALLLAVAVTALAGLVHTSSGPAAGALAGTLAAAGQARSPRAALAGSEKSLPGGAPSIERRLVADVSGLQGGYGVTVIDLASGLTYGVNGNNQFRAASVNKMPILVTLYASAAQGRIGLDQPVTLSESDIQHYGTGTIQEADAPRTYTLRQLAALMVQVSDNTAAYVVERFLGPQTVQQNTRRWRLDHTSMADNTTTPADAASLMADLYADRLLPTDATDEVLSLLQRSVFTDRLAAALPVDVPLAHKIGTDVGVFNDAGLVLLPGRPYAIAILSMDADDMEANAVYIRVSKDVYDFQTSLAAVRRR